jgi:hypothetical protein
MGQQGEKQKEIIFPSPSSSSLRGFHVLNVQYDKPVLEAQMRLMDPPLLIAGTKLTL